MNIPNGHDCKINRNDISVAETARRRGDHRLAEVIETEVSERINRCIGLVMCGGILECGLIHGGVVARLSEVQANDLAPFVHSTE